MYRDRDFENESAKAGDGMFTEEELEAAQEEAIEAWESEFE